MKFIAVLFVCLGLTACVHDPAQFAFEEPEERPSLRKPGAW